MRRGVGWLAAGVLGALMVAAASAAEDRASLAQAGLPSSGPRVLAFSQGIPLVGTERGLYRWSAQESRWVALLGGVPIDDLATLGGEVLIAGEGELYRWMPGLEAPRRAALPPGAEVRSVAADARGRGWVASEAGVFVCHGEGGELERVAGAPLDPQVVRAAGPRVWISAGRAIWAEQADGSFERQLAGLTDGWWELRGAVQDGDSSWLAVPDGLWRIDASGPQRRPLGAPVVGAARVARGLAVVTRDALYCLAGGALPESLAGSAVLTGAVAAAAAPEDDVAVLEIAGVRALSCRVADVPVATLAPVVLPPPAQVSALQRAMLAYLELEPGRLRGVEGRARSRGRWPEIALSLGGDMSRSRDHGRDQSVSTGRINDLIDASRARDGGGQVRLELSWDLADAAKPDALLAVSRERRELIELREQILDRFNRVYFELWRARARAAAALPRSDERAELELRVRELGAVLDAWTGGAFSRLDATGSDEPRR